MLITKKSSKSDKSRPL